MVKRRAAQKSKKATKKNSNNSSSCINDTSQSSSSSSSNANTSLLTTGTFCPALHSMDKCHNYSIPCCNALREILAEIVPDAMHSIRAAGEEDVDLLRIDKGERQPSLLSLLVRMHLLEQRNEQSALNGGKDASGTGGGKKKRRKKRKKKTAVLEDGQNCQELSVDPSSSYASATSSPLAAAAGSTLSFSVSKDSAALPQDLLVANSKDISSQPQDKCIRNTSDISTGETQRGSGTTPLEQRDNLKFNDSKPSCTLGSIEKGIPTQPKKDTEKLKDLRKQERERPSPTLEKFNALLDVILATNPNGTTTSEEIPTRHSPPPLPPPNRTLLALLKFINASYNKSLSSKGSCDHTKRSAIPSLPIKELINMCERVQCSQCRNACVHFVSSLSQTSSSSVEVAWGGRVQPEEQSLVSTKKITLNGASIQMDEDVTKEKKAKQKHGLDSYLHGVSFGNVETDMPVERAFDYMAMEEGMNELSPIHMDENSPVDKDTKVSASGSKEDHLGLHVVKDKDTKIEYLQLCRDREELDMEEGGEKSSSPFTMSNFEKLILDIIVPCGLYELGPAYESEDESKKSSQENEESSTDDPLFVGFHPHRSNLNRSIATRIQRLKDTCETMQNNLITADEGSTASVFNARVPGLLKACSKNCEDFVEDSYELLIMMHYTTINTRVATHDDQKYVQDLMASLWDAYDRMIKGLIEPANTCRWSCIHTSVREGQVTPMFNNKAHREFYRKMVEDKLRHLYNFYDEIDKVLMTSEDDMIPIERLTALAAYFRHSGTITSHQHEGSEHLMKSIASVLCKSSTKFVIEEQKHLVSRCCEGLRIFAKEIYEDVSSGASEMYSLSKYGSHWQAHEIIVQENLDTPANIGEDTCVNDEDQLINVWALVENLTALIRLKEFVEMSARKRGAVRKKIPPWAFVKLDVKDGQKDKQSVPTTNAKCCGGSGKRRVICIISACLYSWLQERCMEWHADLTQKELLSDAKDDEFMNISGVLPGKKRVSKKKRRQVGTRSHHKDDKAEQRDESQSPVDALSEEKTVDGEDLSKSENREYHKDSDIEPMQTKIPLHKSPYHEDKSELLASSTNDGLKEKGAVSSIQTRSHVHRPSDENGGCIEKSGDVKNYIESKKKISKSRVDMRSDKSEVKGIASNPDSLNEGAGESKIKAFREGNRNENNDDGFVTIGASNQILMESKKKAKKKKDDIKVKKDVKGDTNQERKYAKSTEKHQSKAISSDVRKETSQTSKGKRNVSNVRHTSNNHGKVSDDLAKEIERDTNVERNHKTKGNVETASERAVEGAQKRRQPKRTENVKRDLKDGRAQGKGMLQPTLSTTDSDSRPKAMKVSNRTSNTDVNLGASKQKKKAKKGGVLLDVTSSKKVSRDKQNAESQKKSEIGGKRGIKTGTMETRTHEDNSSDMNIDLDESNIDSLKSLDLNGEETNEIVRLEEVLDEASGTRSNDLEETDVCVVDGDTNIPCQTFLQKRLVDVLIEGNYTYLRRSNGL